MAYLCHVRYSLLLSQANLAAATPRGVVGEAEEWREPDEWGDPGPLVKRRWTRIVDGRGQVITGQCNRRPYTIRTMDLIGTLTWADGQFAE